MRRSLLVHLQSVSFVDHDTVRHFFRVPPLLLSSWLGSAAVVGWRDARWCQRHARRPARRSTLRTPRGLLQDLFARFFYDRVAFRYLAQRESVWGREAVLGSLFGAGVPRQVLRSRLALKRFCMAIQSRILSF